MNPGAWSCVLLSVAVAAATASDVLDLSDNSVDGFKSAIADYDAILVEFCKYPVCERGETMSR